MSARRKPGFTVVELLVVIAIIGVLVALLMPAVQMAREAARRSQCAENMRQCGMAIALYANAKGFLPASRTVVVTGPGSPPPTAVVNWVYPVLSELEQSALHFAVRSGDLPTEATPLPVLMCPSQVGNFSSREFPLSYVVNGGRANHTGDGLTNFDWIENGVFIDKGHGNTTGINKHHRIEDIAKHDGTSNTLMLSENANVVGWLHAPGEQFSQMLWFPQGYQRAQSPPDPAFDPAFTTQFAINRNVRDITATLFGGEIRYARPASFHPNGFNVTMCDGSVHWMNDTVDYGVYAVLMTSRGDRANHPASSALTGSDKPRPTWQSSRAAPPDSPYPGTNF